MASNPTWVAVHKPSARVVQHSYVNARLSHINTQCRGPYVEQTLLALQADVPALKKAKREKLVEAYEHITRRLRSAQLTINFKAVS